MRRFVHDFIASPIWWTGEIIASIGRYIHDLTADP